ncbi:hypothetical protein OU798_06395 [Prolixibacteraceae bacterium Z1-6]|uniref:Aminoacylase n=1 Tax=Draconibacterium aestuarii TaxID=2998507 RepID=A0A9X3F3Q0_9BACT|nr:hypothetical protein [Prolixibacteraceae bacterium Z1-6]
MKSIDVFLQKVFRLTLFVILAFLFGGTLFAQDYDLVILNGRVMDPETMLDQVLNVGVNDGNIAIITSKKIEGKETIDASGLVVAPGFIDTHFHALDGLSMKMAARDGITSGMDLEIGATGVEAWYKAKEGAWPINYGTGVSHEGVRILVHDPEVDMPEWADCPGFLGEYRAEACEDGVCGWQDTESDAEHLNEILKIMDEGYQEGALGFCSTVGYMVKGVTTFEMYKCQELAAKYGRLSEAHVRFHANPSHPQGSLGTDEILANALSLNAPLIVAHNNEFGWWENEEKLQKARKQGYNVWSEYYPYEAASTSISSSFFEPELYKNVFGLVYEETMYDPVDDKFLTQEEFLKTRKEDPSRLMVIFSPDRKKWMPNFLRMPHMTAASDAIFSGRGIDSWDVPYEEYQGHPRTAGTRGTVLRLAREEGVPLMFTLSQLSYWSAKHLGDAGIEAMQKRGRMQEGMVADIVIFDAKNVTDNSTYKSGSQGLPTTGIPYVIVNGQMVVKENKFQKIWAGQPIRYEPTDKSRYVPITAEDWKKQHTITTITIDDGGAAGK